MKKLGKKAVMLSATMCLMAAGSVNAAESQETSYTKNFGDVNADGVLDVLDMEGIQKSLLGLKTLGEKQTDIADVDRNGVLNVSDMEAIQKDILGMTKIENLNIIEKTNKNVSVHDPSIIKDEKTGTYYIFGSHMAWAKSTDLVNWETFENNINKDFETLFKDAGGWAARGGTQGSLTGKYEVSGNLWAPDVIWNEKMGKWCMYMSVNGDYWYSSIVLLTADRLDGDWTYVGPVVYSGFTDATEAAQTDYSKAAGTFDAAAVTRYNQNRNGNHTYGMNAIDPCVTYDDDGNLWMTYGSWFGGIYMLRLDESTGLRDYDYTYKTIDNESDIYQGLKIAGGNHVSGEASYIEKMGDYYYLFMSYGGLKAAGGYNMRVFRSESITGPYVDYSGNDARYLATNTDVGAINGTVGVRLMSQYKWNTMELAQVAQGHNSAFVDSDGRAYVVYHTRTNDGTEGHYVKTHQLFMNEEGWLVAAPYAYSGETLNEQGYSVSQVAGTYDVIINEQKVDYANLKYVSPVDVTLNKDGSVSGKYTGTWTLTEGTPYVTIKMNHQTYKGVVVRQLIEGTTDDTMCLTLLGTDEKEVWFSKHLQGKRALDKVVDKITIASVALGDMTLPTETMYGTTIKWKSSDESIIATDGTLTKPEKETEVVLTATFTNNGCSVEKQYKVKVYEASKNDTDPYIIAKYYTGEKIDLSNAEEGTYALPNPFNSANTSGLEIYNGAAIEFDVELNGTMDRLDNIIAFTDAGNGKLYFTGGSYLGYNALGGWYDANMADWALQTDYIGKAARVRIDFLPGGYEVRVNGTLAYTNKTVDAGTTKGTNAGLTQGYSSVLRWLNTTATTLNFGWGSWWDEESNGYRYQYPGTISNVVCYAYPVDKIDTSAYAYYQDYQKGDISEWQSVNILSSLSILTDDNQTRRNYLNIAAGDDSGNRSAYAVFDLQEEITGKYTISVDTSLTAGVLTRRSESAFTILGKDASGYEKNAAVSSGYILKLKNVPPAGTKENQVDKSQQDKWEINDSGKYVTIPVGTWVNITADVDTTAKTAKVTIKKEDGTVLYEDTVNINGNGSLYGLQILRGRGVGTAAVDNIKVTKN